MDIKYYLKNYDNPIGITPTYEPFNTPNFINDLIDYIKNTYGNLTIRRSIMEESEYEKIPINTIISTICSNLYIANKYKYLKLWGSMSFDYNPIENYNMTEHELSQSDNKSNSSITNVSEYGERLETTTLDTHNTTDKHTDIDDIKHSDVYGEKVVATESTRNGSSDGIITDQVSSFDENDWSNKSKQISNDSRSESDRGSSTESSHTDSKTDYAEHTIGEMKEHNTGNINVSNASHTDSVTSSNLGSNNESVDRTLTRSGNIGVTTTQQMLEQERKIALFNIFNIIANDIISAIAIRIY